MKNIKLLLISLVALVSCNKNIEVEITNILNAEVNPGTIISNLVDGSGDDLFTIDNDNEITVGILVFDEVGSYVASNTTTSTNFYNKVNFSIPLETGNYTVVTWACFNFSNGSPVWEISGTQSTSALTFKQGSNTIGYFSSGLNVLGVSSSNITMDGSTNKTFSIECVGSLVNFVFYYENNTKINSVLYGAYKENGSYSPKNSDVTYYYNTDGSLMWVNSFDADHDYIGTYSGSFFYLPLNDIKVEWATYDSNQNELNGSTYTFNTQKGECKNIEFNLNSGTATEIINTKSGTNSNSNLLQSLPQEYKVFQKTK
ncbi:MAG: hypothetical protein R3Y26_02615 [Rikenellaceae bacterium]